MRYHNITKADMLNGEGLRVVLWVSGCSHHCHACQNAVTWNHEDGLVFDDDEKTIAYALPFNPLKDKKIYEDSLKNDWGLQFSHTLEEQIGGQLQAGFQLCDLYEDTNGEGNLHDHHIPTFIATRCIKK